MADHGMETPEAESYASKGSLQTPYISPGMWQRKSPSHQHRDYQRRDKFYKHSNYNNLPRFSTPSGSSFSPRLTREIPQGHSNVDDPRNTNNSLPRLSETVYTPPIYSRNQPSVTNDPVDSVHGEEQDHNNTVNSQSADNVNNKPQQVNIDNADDNIQIEKSSNDKLSCETSLSPLSNLLVSELHDQQNNKQQCLQLTQECPTRQDANANDNVNEIGNVTEPPKKVSCKESYTSFQEFKENQDTDDVHDYIRDMDPVLIEKLLDFNRNTNFHAIALDDSNGENILVARTDDLVVLIDLDSFKLHHWYAVRAGKGFRETMKMKLLQSFEDSDIKNRAEIISMMARCVVYILRFVKQLVKSIQ